MDFDTFKASLGGAAPPSGIAVLLRALWFDANGDWDEAHRIAQDVETSDGARVHAYLHRKEGDLPNARYWYRSAGVAVESGGLDREWEKLARDFAG
ncbi:MAG TPA: hypothetical protein VMG12_22465 [Polyangiaceae bacterium]|nr:hypothetical protein [Polyangiaceae bacterium]